MRDYNLLDTLIAQVDATDKEILFMLKRRMQTVRKIAEYKKKNEIEHNIEERESEVLGNLGNLAKQMKLREMFVQEIYEIILDESKKIQEEIIAKE
ncbi:MAG: chorismate mutase [Nanoarchaeota archaeon]